MLDDELPHKNRSGNGIVPQRDFASSLDVLSNW